MPDLASRISLLRLASRDRTQLVLENIVLRHQLAVYKRSVGRPNITDCDGVSALTLLDGLIQASQAGVWPLEHA